MLNAAVGRDKKIATFPKNHIAWNLLWSLVRIGEDLESSHDVSGEPVSRLAVERYITQTDYGAGPSRLP
jgi:hypothetical protein